jgi:tryptophanyl-tRNA synthetase
MRNPTIKDEIRDKGLGDNYSLGFLNFPVMMAADILSVKADLVPVGEDQNPHVELTRELARKFNATYNCDVLKEPKALIGKVARLIGTDGNAKMTKSLGNTIYLSDDEKTLKEKVMHMYTDPKRLHPTDPGTVEGNPVFIYHDVFNPNTAEVADLKSRYKVGKVGDVEVKEKLFIALNNFLVPIREKRAYYEQQENLVRDIIASGNGFVSKLASLTLKEARSAMKL